MTIKERYRKVFDYFEKEKPAPVTELNYTDAFSLLVSVILSAQCTDRRVNMIAPALLEAFPDPASMAKASPDDIFAYIKSCSYPNSKARHLCGMAREVVTSFNGIIPSEPTELVKLPGVGRKTANVIASVVFNKPVMAVDTHVFRVSERIGLTTNARNPLECEKQLVEHIPESLMHKAHHWLILHGRYVCLSRRPLCDECGLKDVCRWFMKTGAKKIKPENKKLKAKSA
jgi:endonuclease III